MTQPNQSELEALIFNLWGRALDVTSSEDFSKDEDYLKAQDNYRKYCLKEWDAYITANYTPNTKLKALIEASEKLNLEFHGRPDCKNCSLQEQLAELIKAKKATK